ncbi:MAG: response regulator transcription factor [Mesorhizobium sp.]|jgi:two-component system OmpR family response regulator
MAGRPCVALLCMSEEAALPISDYLERRGYELRCASGEWEADALLSAGGVDVAVTGLDDDGGPGMELLRRHSSETGPAFVMIGNGHDLIVKVLALELGAADVVGEPVNPRELATRVGGLLARRGKPALDLVVLENSTVDMKAAMVMHKSGNEEQLSPGQIALLRLFLAHPHKVLTRDCIIAAAPAENSDAYDRSIDSRIVRLRRKLDTESIATIRGAGYRFDPPGEWQ